MCDYCDCRSQPEIAVLSDQHEQILSVIAALRRALADGVDSELAPCVSALSDLLLPHARREEVGVFAQLRDAVSTGYVGRFEREHVEIERQLTAPALDRSSLASVLDVLSEHILDEETDMYPAARQLLDATQWAAVDHAVQHLYHPHAHQPDHAHAHAG